MTATPNVPGGCPLTPSELQVIILLSEGLSYRQIATRLRKCRTTLRTLVSTACRRLGVENGMQAVVKCLTSGWIDPNVDPAELAMLWQLQTLQQILRDLTAAVRSRSERDLTPTQRSYLDSFEDHLRAETPTDRARTRADADQSLAAMLDEARDAVRQTRTVPRT